MCFNCYARIANQHISCTSIAEHQREGMYGSSYIWGLLEYALPDCYG